MSSIGPPELLIILLILVLLFGARKLPDLARGTGRALRIFKAETKGLTDDDEDEDRATDTSRSRLTSPRTQPATDPSAPTNVDTSGSLPPTHTEQ